MKLKCPCNGCSDRSMKCHSECIKYKDWKEKYNDEQNKINIEKYKMKGEHLYFNS